MPSPATWKSRYDRSTAAPQPMRHNGKPPRPSRTRRRSQPSARRLWLTRRPSCPRRCDGKVLPDDVRLVKRQLHVDGDARQLVVPVDIHRLPCQQAPPALEQFVGRSAPRPDWIAAYVLPYLAAVVEQIAADEKLVLVLGVDVAHDAAGASAKWRTPSASTYSSAAKS